MIKVLKGGTFVGHWAAFVGLLMVSSFIAWMQWQVNVAYTLVSPSAVCSVDQTITDDDRDGVGISISCGSYKNIRLHSPKIVASVLTDKAKSLNCKLYSDNSVTSCVTVNPLQ
jgi:hypothetical protein